LCENPNNSNLWLSDPETTAVIKSIFHVFHVERFNVDMKNYPIINYD